MNWKNSGATTKSDAEINRLVRDVLLNPDFELGDLKGFNVTRENKRSDDAEKKSPSWTRFKLPASTLKFPLVQKAYRPLHFCSRTTLPQN